MHAYCIEYEYNTHYISTIEQWVMTTMSALASRVAGRRLSYVPYLVQEIHSYIHSFYHVRTSSSCILFRKYLKNTQCHFSNTKYWLENGWMDGFWNRGETTLLLFLIMEVIFKLVGPRPPAHCRMWRLIMLHCYYCTWSTGTRTILYYTYLVV